MSLQPKVLVVMPLAHQRGGAEMALSHLVQHAKETGIEWIIAFLEDGPAVEQYRHQGLQTHVVEAGRMREPGKMIGCVRTLASLAKSLGVACLFSWMTKAHLYAAPAAKLAGVPAVWFQHQTPMSGSMLDRAATLLPASLILACSSDVARLQQERLKPRRSVSVVYPGVDLARFDPDTLPAPLQIRRMLGIPENGPLIGMVARLQRWKGVHVLIEAIPSILQSEPNARCVIVGGEHDLEPDYASSLRSRIDELGLAGRIILAGLQQNVPEWMQAMDVVVHASDREPFGMVIVEAMALGKPVVAAASGGPLEIITDGVDGMLSPWNDAPALAQKIVALLHDPERLVCNRRARQGAGAGLFDGAVCRMRGRRRAGRLGPNDFGRRFAARCRRAWSR